MRKIPNTMENPIDNIFIDAAEKSIEYYKACGFTPNMLTTLSLITGLIAFLYFVNGYNILGALFYLISYYYDCCDGFFARKYHMETELGDVYDHLVDWSKLLLILFAMYIRNAVKFVPYTIGIGIMTLLSVIHFSCQEKNYDSDVKQPLLDKLKGHCGNSDDIYKTRYFGTGTLTLVIVIMMATY